MSKHAISKQDKADVKSKVEHYLCILVFDEQMIAYESKQSQLWQLISLKGSPQYPHRGNLNSLRDVLDDLSENLNLKDKLAKIKVSLIYQQGKDHLLNDAVKLLQDYLCQSWQILNWNSLYHYTHQVLNTEQPFFDTRTVDHVWVQDHLLPLVWQENSIEHQQHAVAALRLEKNQMEEQIKLLQSDAEQALAQQVGKLERDKQLLEQQISAQRVQLAKLQQPDLESLLAYLPAIFKDFWNEVRPDELANTVGVLNTPHVPSPYNSPSLSIVQQKKRQFLAISTESQDKILDLCRELAQSHHQLAKNVHQEFKVLVGALD